MKVKLCEPESGKNWSLQFFNVPFDQKNPNGNVYNVLERSDIWYECRNFGEIYNTKPFLQGDSFDWMMVEFWCNDQTKILECCIKICERLNLQLEL